MSKRRPTSQLNHDNWDQEEEPEDIGQYTPLSAKELQASGRVVKKAKRRLRGPDTSEHVSLAPSGRREINTYI